MNESVCVYIPACTLKLYLKQKYIKQLWKIKNFLLNEFKGCKDERETENKNPQNELNPRENWSY